MKENKTTQVTMTAAERAEFEAFRAKKAKEEQDAKMKMLRSSYNDMIDDEVNTAIPELITVSEDIQTAKQKVLDNFKTVLEMKSELFRLKEGADIANKSHTFTSSDGTKRIIIGQRMADDWADTAELGVRKIVDYIQSLATDEKSKALVAMVMKLLARDAKGTLNAQRILQLKNVAENAGVQEIIEGVNIIVEAYRPVPTRTYVYAYHRDDKTSAWKPIPLGMTES